MYIRRNVFFFFVKKYMENKAVELPKRQSSSLFDVPQPKSFDIKAELLITSKPMLAELTSANIKKIQLNECKQDDTYQINNIQRYHDNFVNKVTIKDSEYSTSKSSNVSGSTKKRKKKRKRKSSNSHDKPVIRRRGDSISLDKPKRNTFTNINENDELINMNHKVTILTNEDISMDTTLNDDKEEAMYLKMHQIWFLNLFNVICCIDSIMVIYGSHDIIWMIIMYLMGYSVSIVGIGGLCKNIKFKSRYYLIIVCVFISIGNLLYVYGVKHSRFFVFLGRFLCGMASTNDVLTYVWILYYTEICQNRIKCVTWNAFISIIGYMMSLLGGYIISRNNVEFYVSKNIDISSDNIGSFIIFMLSVTFLTIYLIYMCIINIMENKESIKDENHVTERQKSNEIFIISERHNIKKIRIEQRNEVYRSKNVQTYMPLYLCCKNNNGTMHSFILYIIHSLIILAFWIHITILLESINENNGYIVLIIIATSYIISFIINTIITKNCKYNIIHHMSWQKRFNLSLQTISVGFILVSNYNNNTLILIQITTGLFILSYSYLNITILTKTIYTLIIQNKLTNIIFNIIPYFITIKSLRLLSLLIAFQITSTKSTILKSQ